MKKILLLFITLVSLVYSNTEKSVNIMLGYDKPPFIFSKTSNAGIEADVVREAFELVGYKVNISQGTRAKQEAVLYEKNSLDGVATITTKDKKFFSSDTISNYRNVVVTRKKENITISSIDDLTKIKFVAWKNSFNDLGKKYYNYFNPKDGKYKKSYNDNFSQLDDAQMFFSKKVDALVIDKTIFNWFKLYFEIDEEFTIHNIFNQVTTFPATFKDKKIRDIFNTGLRKLKKNGRYDEIINFYQTQNIEKLITYTNLLSDIASKYMFNNEDKKIQQILKLFLSHPDIILVNIQRLDDNSNTTTISKKKNLQIKDYQPLSSKIYYTKKRDILPLGNLTLYYKKDYKAKNGILIPHIEVFKDLDFDDYNYIYTQYKKYGLINNAKINLSNEEIQYLQNHKTITVHNEKDWIPYNFNDNGIPKGFSIDYMDLIAKRLGIDIKYIQGKSWNQYLKMLKESKIDVIVNVVKNPQRERYMLFTDSYIESKKAIFSNIPNISSFSDLKGKTVAIPKGFYTEDYIKRYYPKINIRTYKNIKDTLYAVVNKEAHALVENIAVMKALMKKNGVSLPYVSLKEDKELTSQLRIGVNKNNKVLRDIIQKAKNTITQEEYNKLEEKWFGIKDLKELIFSQKEREYIKNKKTVKVCAHINQYPFVIFNEDKTRGFSPEYLAIISQKSELDFEIIMNQTSEEYFEKLEKKECDVASLIMTKPNKFDYLKSSNPILSDTIVLVTDINSPYIYDLKNLKNEKIAIQQGTSNLQNYVKSIYPNINLVEVNDVTLDDIVSGKYYGYIGGSYQLAYKISTQYFNKLKIMSKIGDKKVDGSFGINKDEPVLLDIFNKSIDSMSDLEKQVIRNAWLSVNVEKHFDYTRFFQLLVVALIIILILIYSNIKQRRLHEEITQLNDTLVERVNSEVEKNKQQQLLVLRQNRLAQMGEMISMIAHQWRQPLNSLAILNSTIILQHTKEKLDQKAMEEFKVNSKKQIKQMSETIDDFKNFFKPQKEKVKFCINDIVVHTLDILKPILQQTKIEVIVKEEDQYYLNSYKNELGQVILNILNNAKDALIEQNVSDKKIEISLFQKNQSIYITIADNAGGIDSNIIDNIFDPYFSTKDEKNGTGLGLYMSKMIIEDHMNGLLDVHNKDNGVVFTLKLDI